MLTPKQEAFAKAIAWENMNYSDAYRSAYNTSKMTDKSINEKASLLKDDVKIRSRIQELRAELDSPRIMNAQQRREKLTEHANSEDPMVSIRAIDILNKMDGEYVQKIEAEVQTETTINIELVDDDEY